MPRKLKKRSITSQLLGLMIILISIPVTVILVRSFTLYLIKASGARVYWAQGKNTDLHTLNLTTVEQPITLMLDTGTSSDDPNANNQVGYFQVKIGFDNSLVHLSRPVNVGSNENISDLNPYFHSNINSAIIPDTQEKVNTVNATGEILISLTGDPNREPLTRINGIIRFYFHSIKDEATTTKITFIEKCHDHDNNAIPCTNIAYAFPPFNSLPTQLDSLTLNLNPQVATLTHAQKYDSKTTITTPSPSTTSSVTTNSLFQDAPEISLPIEDETSEHLCGNQYLPGDIDNDCDIDIIDYGILFEDFEKLTTNPNLIDFDSDINLDGTINILDYIHIFGNFGAVSSL